MPESEEWPEGRPTPQPVRHGPEVDRRTGSAAAANRIRQQTRWVDLQVREAIERGEFDDLPGHGRPIQGLDREHDPDWWLKKLVEREQIVVLPPSIQLRKDDAELDDLLDQQHREDDARRIIEEFNERVIAARYGLPQGPPLITMPRDVEATLAGWRERREARWAREAEEARRAEQTATRPRRRWFRRRRRGRHSDAGLPTSE